MDRLSTEDYPQEKVGQSYAVRPYSWHSFLWQFTKTQTQKLSQCFVGRNSLYLTSKAWCIKPNHRKYYCDIDEATHVPWPVWASCGWSTWEAKLEPQGCLGDVRSELGALDVHFLHRSIPAQMTEKTPRAEIFCRIEFIWSPFLQQR